MGVVLHLAWWICVLFLVAMWTRIILTWVSVLPGSPLESLSSIAYTVTEPVLGPVRRMLPTARLGGAALDLSPFVVSILVIVVMGLL